jgi:3-carboxy-cis,cis-muconate cycloisomerase
MLRSTASSPFSTPAMDLIFSASRQLACMTRFEWALLVSLEANGIAPSGAASRIAQFLDGHFVEMDPLIDESRQAGNIAIPFVRALTRAVAQQDETAAGFVHLGATSQDVLDTALVLQMRDALDLIQAEFNKLETSLEKQVRTHAGTILCGRTWLQAGPPVTLGLKLAAVLSALRRHRQRLLSARERAVALQFGGAVGTLSSLGEKGQAVSAVLAQTLDLPEPLLPWHTQRDNLVEAATCLGLLVGTLGKFAKDISLLMQTEVAEVAEPAQPGRGVSSTMPHKRNPVASAVILAVATRAPSLVATLLHSMLQEHERGLGAWQAEWETLPEIFCLTASALACANEIAENLEVDAERMQANLANTHGLIFSEAVSAALARSIGRSQAHALLENASQEAIGSQTHLRDVLRKNPEICKYLSDSDLDRLFDPRNSLGSTYRFIERVLEGSDGPR